MKNGYCIGNENVFVQYFSSLSEFNSVSETNCQDRYEIIFSISSLGVCNVEGNEYLFNPRSVLILSPLSFHKFSVNENSPHGYSVCFSTSALTPRVFEMLKKIMSDDADFGKFYSSLTITDALCDIFRRIDDACLLSGEEQAAFLDTLVCELIIFLSAADYEVNLRSEHELGARVSKYLNSNIEKSISLDKLANRFFVSKYHLCRAFKKYSGVSVHSYINHKRIIHAKMLIESGQSASKAAERVGFGDYSAFYRAYVRIVGKAPTKE
jgi:AraC-like DNA-binding protein